MRRPSNTCGGCRRRSLTPFRLQSQIDIANRAAAVGDRERDRAGRRMVKGESLFRTNPKARSIEGNPADRLVGSERARNAPGLGDRVDRFPASHEDAARRVDGDGRTRMGMGIAIIHVVATVIVGIGMSS